MCRKKLLVLFSLSPIFLSRSLFTLHFSFIFFASIQQPTEYWLFSCISSRSPVYYSRQVCVYDGFLVLLLSPSLPFYLHFACSFSFSLQYSFSVLIFSPISSSRVDVVVCLFPFPSALCRLHLRRRRCNPLDEELYFFFFFFIFVFLLCFSSLSLSLP